MEGAQLVSSFPLPKCVHRKDLKLTSICWRPAMEPVLHDRSDDDYPMVLVIDDDPEVREGLGAAFESVNLQSKAFGSAEEFFRSKLPEGVSCLVLDVRLPGLNGLDLQTELAKAQIDIPIIFITGHGDIPMSVRAMKAGAVEFLTKPFREQDLLDAVRIALDRDRKRRELDKTTHDLRIRFGRLSPREREVMTLVAAGLMSRQIATEMGISEVTVKAHKARIMKKLGANSPVDLVRMADTLGLPQLRRDLETGEVDLPTDQILLGQVDLHQVDLHQADAAIGHKLDARSGLSRKNTPATCDTLPTPAVPPTPGQDSPSTGDEPFRSLET
jgi:FixJ family two-component response regulator